MKLSKRSIMGILILGCIAVSTSGCAGKIGGIIGAPSPEIGEKWQDYKEQETIIMDNPTDKAITFKIDDKEYTLQPKEMKEEPLKNGQHTMTVPGKSEPIPFEQKETYRKSLVNPTGSQYIIWSDVYRNKPGSALPSPSVRTSLVYIDGKEYEDLLQSVNDYFVPREKNQPWRWGLDEEMPEEVTVSNYDKDSTYALKYGKIYRATDFVKDYESYQAAKK